MKMTELPSFEAQWWPVMLETVPGSGEQIAVAVVVRAAAGQSQVRQTIQPAALASMFGEAGKGMVFIVGKTVLSIRQQLDAGVPPLRVEMPFGGLALGRERECLAHDMNEVFEVAFRLGGAFGVSNFGRAEAVSEETRRAFDEWAAKVREELLAAAADDEARASWARHFNVPIALLGRKKARFGLVRDDYAANFGVLRAGREASADVRALKVKLFDLEALRRSQPMLVHRLELVVGTQRLAANGPLPARAVAAHGDSWDFIAHEALQRNISLVRARDAAEAAAHIRSVLAAA